MVRTMNSPKRYYVAGNADLDSDSDQVPDAREVLVYKSDPGVADTDGDGIADVRNGKAPVGMVSRGLHDDEADLRAHTIALDGLGIILHRDNPLRELSSAQVAAIYAGTISDWSEIGGSPGRIVVVHKAEGRATLELFLEHCQLDNAAVRADVIVGDNAQGIKQVAASPQAIGYVSIGAARVSAELGEAIRLPALDGVAADLANVRSGRWPIIRQLNLVTRGPPDPFAAELIAYARSSAVADLCTELAFVPPR